jgi:uncharacterized protein YyaL (SSP411 family)
VNRLAEATSAYLRTAKDQPVFWHPWGPEAFALARAEDKPMLLDIGAVWCHWCHVMDHESYENPEIAEILNRDWICMKVDRDERPDVDVRYQRAVQAISGQGGWPLTAFLTPEGEVFYGGTYFPPEPQHGRPGFATVLNELAHRFRHERETILKQAAEITAHLAPEDGSVVADELTETILDGAADAMARAFDFRYGGFGTAPKFPHAAACEFLLAYWFDTRHPWAREVVERTLTGMANGGIRDHLGGGFHRYSVDSRWILPHFEKMSYDNAALLQAYADAYAAWPETDTATSDLVRQVVEGIVRWVMTTMSSPEGGYFASQDADVGPDDDGDYFTWTVDETKAVTTPDEFAVISRYYGIDAVGDMHHNPQKNVLHIAQPVSAIATLLEKPEEEVGRLLASAQLAMLEARETRSTPYVDETLYTGWNAMMASAIMAASAALRRRELDAHALATLEMLTSTVLIDGPERGAKHAVGSPVGGILDDQVQLASAFIDAFEITGETVWLERAESLMTHVVGSYGVESGGLRDALIAATEPKYLSQEIQPVQDSPTPSPIGVAAIVMSRLAALTGREEWRAHRDRILEPVAGRLTHLAVFGATMLRAVDWAVRPLCHVVVVGGEEARPLVATVRRVYRPRKVLTWMRDGSGAAHLPEAMRAMLDGTTPRAYVCYGNTCAPPVGTQAELETTLRTFGVGPKGTV